MADDARAADFPQPGMPTGLATDDHLVRRAMLLIQQELASPVSMERLAIRLGVSRRKLERHFTAATGLTPNDAARRIRIDRAKHLLASTKLSIGRIALETGYCDTSHLIRAFRRETGEAPGYWRETCQEDRSSGIVGGRDRIHFFGKGQLEGPV